MDELFIGSILLLPYTFAPQGTLPCDGRMLQIVEYSPLFALIGNTYGGNGTTTFALPNMLGLEPSPNMNYCIVTDGIFPTRG
jgi:microcystin-dependent protein